MFRSESAKKGRRLSRLDREQLAQRVHDLGLDRADQLLALALGVDQARVGELLDVVRDRRRADVEPTEELGEEAVVDAPLGESNGRASGV